MRTLLLCCIVALCCSALNAQELPTELRQKAAKIAAEAAGQERHQQQIQSDRSKRIVVLYADWANYDDQTRKVLRKLREAGWSVGPEPHNQIQAEEIEPHDDRLAEWRIGNLPVYIKIRHGHEYERHTGRLTAVDVWEMYHGREYRPEQQSRYERSDSAYTREEADRYLRRNYGVSADEVERQTGKPLSKLATRYGITIREEQSEPSWDQYRRTYEAPVQSVEDCAFG